MKPRSRKLPRILFLLLVLALLAAGAILAGFESWRAGRLAELYSNSEIAKTSVGDVEFARRGEGHAILILHDAAGGYDQGLALAGFLAEEGFEVLSMSRPGYLRTPLASGLLPENQADAAAALLQTLSIPKASIVAFGWGAPAAIHFAARHPDRLSSLVLASPVLTPPLPAAGSTQFPQALAEDLTGDIGAWLYHKEAQDRPVSALGQAYNLTASGSPSDRDSWSDVVVSDPAQLETFRDLVLTLSPLSPRENGIRNDILQTRSLPALPLEKISSPTLVVHGGIDKAVPLAAVEAAGTKIPGSAFQLVPDAGHLVLLGRGGPATSARITSFLRENSRPPADTQ